MTQTVCCRDAASSPENQSAGPSFQPRSPQQLFSARREDTTALPLRELPGPALQRTLEHLPALSLMAASAVSACCMLVTARHTTAGDQMGMLLRAATSAVVFFDASSGWLVVCCLVTPFQFQQSINSELQQLCCALCPCSCDACSARHIIIPILAGHAKVTQLPASRALSCSTHPLHATLQCCFVIAVDL